MGRDEDILWFEDGFDETKSSCIPLPLKASVWSALWITSSDRLGRTHLRCMLRFLEMRIKRIPTEILDQMKKILSEKKLDYVQFYVIFVDEILPDLKTGKKTLILQKKEAWQDEKSVIAG